MTLAPPAPMAPPPPVGICRCFVLAPEAHPAASPAWALPKRGHHRTRRTLSSYQVGWDRIGIGLKLLLWPGDRVERPLEPFHSCRRRRHRSTGPLALCKLPFRDRQAARWVPGNTADKESSLSCHGLHRCSMPSTLLLFFLVFRSVDCVSLSLSFLVHLSLTRLHIFVSVSRSIGPSFTLSCLYSPMPTFSWSRLFSRVVSRLSLTFKAACVSLIFASC